MFLTNSALRILTSSSTFTCSPHSGMSFVLRTTLTLYPLSFPGPTSNVKVSDSLTTFYRLYKDRFQFTTEMRQPHTDGEVTGYRTNFSPKTEVVRRERKFDRDTDREPFTVDPQITHLLTHLGRVLGPRFQIRPDRISFEHDSVSRSWASTDGFLSYPPPYPPILSPVGGGPVRSILHTSRRP